MGGGAGDRLVTYVDLDGPQTRTRMSVSARLELCLDDGRRIVLLDDRGWSSTGPADIWSHQSLDDLCETARAVVGPDEPIEGETWEEAKQAHWAGLARIATHRSVEISAEELSSLPHDVELSAAVRARLA